MYSVIEDRWLLNLDEGLTVTDLVENRTFFAPKSAELDEVAEVMHESEIGRVTSAEATTALHCEYQGSDVSVQLSRKLASGLEFKPKKMVLQPQPGSVTSAVKELVLASRLAAAGLAKAKKELDLVYEANQDMTAERTRIQDATLQRVCAILEERNFWIEKFRNGPKDEINDGSE